MASSRRIRSRLGLLPIFCCLLLCSCAPPSGDQLIEHPLGFRLRFGADFNMFTTQDGESSTVTLFRKEGASEPRLVIRVLPRLLSLGEMLEQQLVSDARTDIITETEPFDVELTNASGLGIRQRFRPMPQLDPEFELQLDLRILPHGDHYYCFFWRLGPSRMEEWMPRYEGWLESLIFQ